jgi:hypothetical protein
MQTYLETTTYMQNGTRFSTGLPGEPNSVMFDPSQVAGNTYNIVSQPTDQWGLFVTTTPLPEDYGQTTITPITKYDVQIQQNLQALEMTTIILATAATDTERFAPELLAPEGTTALSTYRVTQEGETFFHYGYTENAASFESGLNPGGYATSAGDLSGTEAQSGLALPHNPPPNAVYTVSPTPGTPIRVNPVASPNFGQPGGLPEYQFPVGTAPGTVSTPTPIP